MKIYEVLKEMIEDKKIILKKKTDRYDSDEYYKRVKTEDGIDLILHKFGANSLSEWRVANLSLGVKDLESNNWEIHEGEVK